MKEGFSRRELYELVWSQPMRTLASAIGISDVALAKHCKKANIPVPERGYWARKQTGKPTHKATLPFRFPGASDRIGGDDNRNSWSSDWAEEYLRTPIPAIPVFDEELSSVSERVRKLVPKIKRPRDFAIAHPLVARLLSHDDERRKDYARYPSSYYAPRYDSGIERRRLLVINILFLESSRLGCRPSMQTSKYSTDNPNERDVSIQVGNTHVRFSVEQARQKKEGHQEVLRLALGVARDRDNSTKFWIDDETGPLEAKLSEILIGLLIHAEEKYRESLLRRREWVIERKAEAEKEIEKRRREAERKTRELEVELSKERIERLIGQAEALNRAAYIRSYIQGVIERRAELSVPEQSLAQWVAWATAQADQLDPIKNGTIDAAIRGGSAAV